MALPPALSNSPLSSAPDGMRLAVRVMPKASSERVIGILTGADGEARLKVAVTAAPEDGKANAKLTAFLAKQLKVAKSDIVLLQGHTQRNKLLFIKGATPALEEWLDAFRSEQE